MEKREDDPDARDEEERHATCVTPSGSMKLKPLPMATKRTLGSDYVNLYAWLFGCLPVWPSDHQIQTRLRFQIRVPSDSDRFVGQKNPRLCVWLWRTWHVPWMIIMYTGIEKLVSAFVYLLRSSLFLSCPLLLDLLHNTTGVRIRHSVYF